MLKQTERKPQFEVLPKFSCSVMKMLQNKKNFPVQQSSTKIEELMFKLFEITVCLRTKHKLTIFVT